MTIPTGIAGFGKLYEDEHRRSKKGEMQETLRSTSPRDNVNEKKAAEKAIKRNKIGRRENEVLREKLELKGFGYGLEFKR